MFQIKTFKTAKLNSVNARSEKHGPDELAPAVDLSFTIESTNAILNSFSSELLDALYFKNEDPSDGDQALIDGIEEFTDAPNLRFPSMATPIKWDKDQAGYTLTIDYGLGTKQSNLVLDPCQVNNFQITPHEGGTVEVKFRVQCSSGLSERVLGKLALLIQHEVPIMLIEPEVAQVQTMENPLPGNPTPDKPLTATDVFLSQAEMDARDATVQ